MRPVTLCFSGLDPSGGAGLQADIESVAALGGHAAVVATALTVQDSAQVLGFEMVSPALLQAQARCVLADLPVRAVKLGMLGMADTVAAVFEVLAAHPELPVVMDPVLAANGGGSLAREDLRQALISRFEQTALITPNTLEARQLAGCDDLDEALRRLQGAGARAILLKGGHEPGEIIHNRLVVNGDTVATFPVTRLAGEFHGSGCTLAAAIAAGLAAGLSLREACAQGFRFTGEALRMADRARDGGQWLPRRVQGGA